MATPVPATRPAWVDDELFPFESRFVDLDGHRNDAPVRTALTELARRAPYLKLLGSYPVAAY